MGSSIRSSIIFSLLMFLVSLSPVIVESVATGARAAGDVTVYSRTNGGSTLTADKIMIYDSNWNHFGTATSATSLTCQCTPGDSYIIESYVDNMWLDDTTVTASTSGTIYGYLYANSQVSLTARAYYSDGSTRFGGANVKLYSWDGTNNQWDYERQGTTNSNGEYSFSVYPTTKTGEKYKLAVYDGTTQVGTDSNVRLTSSKTETITTSVSVPSSVRATVNVVADTLILLVGNTEVGRVYNSQSSTWTNANPGTQYRAEAYVNNMHVGEASVTAVSGQTVTAAITVNSQVSLTARAYYNDGSTRFSGSLIYLYSWDGYNRQWDSEDSCTANSNGECTFSVYPTTKTGEKYKLAVYDGTTQVGTDSNVRLTSSKTETITTSVSVPSSVRATVNVVADTLILLVGNTEVGRVYNSQSSTWTNANPGTQYRAEAYVNNMHVGEASVTAVSGQTVTAAITVNSQVSLTVRATYSDGPRFPGATAQLYSWDGYNSQWDSEDSCTTNSNGECTFSVYPTGLSGEKYKLVIFDGGSEVGSDSMVRLTSSTTKSIGTIVTSGGGGGSATPDMHAYYVGGVSSMEAGSTASISYDARNTGDATAASNRFGIYLSVDNQILTSDTLLYDWTNVQLTAGSSSSSSKTVTVPSSTSAGTYYWGFCVDIYNSITESSESNNCVAGGTVQISQSGGSGGGNANDDHGDSPGDATLINPTAGPHYGEIEENGDDDYFFFLLGDDWADVYIEVQLDTLSDSKLYLYSDDGTEIAYNDDSNGYASAIQQNFLQAGTYYVMIEAYGTYTGTYQWTFTGTEQSSGNSSGGNGPGTSDDHGNDFSTSTLVNL